LYNIAWFPNAITVNPPVVSLSSYIIFVFVRVLE